MPSAIHRIRTPLGLVALSTALLSCGPQQSSTPSAPAAAPPAPVQAAAVTGAPELGSFGVDLSDQDRSVAPGDDFFRYTNGKWLNEFELPQDRSNYGLPLARKSRRIRLSNIE